MSLHSHPRMMASHSQMSVSRRVRLGTRLFPVLPWANKKINCHYHNPWVEKLLSVRGNQTQQKEPNFNRTWEIWVGGSGPLTTSSCLFTVTGYLHGSESLVRSCLVPLVGLLWGNQQTSRPTASSLHRSGSPRTCRVDQTGLIEQVLGLKAFPISVHCLNQGFCLPSFPQKLLLISEHPVSS